MDKKLQGLEELVAPTIGKKLFSKSQIAKIEGFDGTYDPVTDTGYWKGANGARGSVITNPSQLDTVALQGGVDMSLYNGDGMLKSAAPASTTGVETTAQAYLDRQMDPSRDVAVGLGSYTSGNGADSKTNWGMDGYGGVALGAGQLGLGVLSYLENSATSKKQRELMTQQIAQNKFVLNQAEGRQADIARDFGVK